MLSVGAVRPLAAVAPLGGAGLMDDCQSHVDLNDDVVSVWAWAPTNRPPMCCARLDDFDWVPNYDPDILLSGQDIGVGITDLTRDIQVLPDVIPEMLDERAAVRLPLPVVVETGSPVGYNPDILVSGWDIEVGVLDITPDIRVLLDVFTARFDETAAVPLSSPVVADTRPQVDIRRGTTRAAVVDEITLRVTTVGLSNDESVRQFKLLNSKYDRCFVDESVLVPEMSPIVSVRGTAVPTSLPTISEGFSSAVLAGGGGVFMIQFP